MKVRPKRYFPTSDWLEGFPQNHTLDGAKLLSIRAHVEARLPHVRSIIVARHGYIVFEMYRQGFGRDSVLNLASITKSVTALLAGVVIARSQLSLTDRIVERFPGLIDSPDSRAAHITVEHLLNMTAGFDWTDARVAQWRDRQEEPRYPLRHAMNAKPGALFNYDTPASHLLSAVLARAAGQSLDELADAALFSRWASPPGSGREMCKATHMPVTDCTCARAMRSSWVCWCCGVANGRARRSRRLTGSTPASV